MSSESEEEAEFNDNDDDDEEEVSAKSSAEDEEEEDDDDDDDVPLSALKKRKTEQSSPTRNATKNRVVSYKEASSDEEEDDDDESDDDIPLSALATNKSPKSPKKKTTTKKESTTNGNKKKKVTSAATTTNNNSSTSTNKNYEWASAALYGTESLKGLLIQRLLCRWWYAYTWPDPSTLPKQPPPHYDSLDGFPGVYVCTEGPDVGKILDVRDPTQKPCFANLYQKSSQELQQMLLTALENQKKQLIKIEGSGTSTEKEIDNLYKWTQKVNTTKADKEAVKILKAQGLSVP